MNSGLTSLNELVWEKSAIRTGRVSPEDARSCFADVKQFFQLAQGSREKSDPIRIGLSVTVDIIMLFLIYFDLLTHFLIDSLVLVDLEIFVGITFDVNKEHLIIVYINNI